MSMVNVRNLGFGGSGIPDTLPQAIAELQGMRMDVVTGAAAGTLMPVSGIDLEDTIGSVVDLTTPASVDPTTCTVAGRNASGTITCLTTAVDGDKVTVNGKVYTFKNVIVHTSYNAPPGVIPTDITPSGSDPEDMALKLSKAIMSGDSTVTATVGLDASSPPKMAKVTVKVRQPGTAGNAYTLTETGNAATVSGATFTGGVASGSSGFTSTVNLTGKKLLVVWYDRHPGVATAPLMMRAASFGDEDDEDHSLGEKRRAMRFRGGKEEEVGPDDSRDARDARDEGRDDGRNEGRDDKGRGRGKSGPTGR